MTLFIFDLLLAAVFIYFAVRCFKKAVQISRDKKNNDFIGRNDDNDRF